jgi:hypothetical protein
LEVDLDLENNNDFAAAAAAAAAADVFGVTSCVVTTTTMTTMTTMTTIDTKLKMNPRKENNLGVSSSSLDCEILMTILL